MKNVFFLVGPHGVGKTYIVNKLKKDYNVEHIDLGPLIREAHKIFSPNISLSEWIKDGEEKYGENFTDIILCKQIERLFKGQDKDITIITGSRSLNGIKFIANRFSIENPQIVYIVAPFEQLKNNYQRRERINLTDEQFKMILQQEKDMGLEQLEQYAIKSCVYLQNDNTDSFIETMEDIIIKSNVKEREDEK